MSRGSVLVAIPYYGAQDLIARAVRSVLAQTYRNLICLVAGDGDDPSAALADFHDPRLVIHTFADNRGAPMTQQAMLLASPCEWYAPFGADDYADRYHIAYLLAPRHPAVITGKVYWHRSLRGLPHDIKEVAYEVGIFQTEVLRSIGGYCSEERMSQDSLLVNLLQRTHNAVKTRKPTYHRYKHAESLTRRPDTDFESPARMEAMNRNMETLAAIEKIGYRNLDEIRAYRDSLLSAKTRKALEARVEELRPVLRTILDGKSFTTPRRQGL